MFLLLHLGNNVSVPIEDIVGIFDLDNVSTSRRTREYLKNAENEGMVIPAGSDLPKSLVVCCPNGSWQKVYLSPLTPNTLLGRMETLTAAFSKHTD